MFNPKIEIVNYFDEMIHQVDIDIEDALENSNIENQVLGNLKCFTQYNRERINEFEYNPFNNFNLFEPKQNIENQTFNLWSESTKVIDYLNQVRMKTIEKLKKAQDEAFEYYKLNSSRFSYLKEMKDEEKLEELKSQLFAEKFYFQIRLKNEYFNKWIFKLFTFVTDFYMSPSDINTLEYFSFSSR